MLFSASSFVAITIWLYPSEDCHTYFWEYIFIWFNVYSIMLYYHTVLYIGLLTECFHMTFFSSLKQSKTWFFSQTYYMRFSPFYLFQNPFKGLKRWKLNVWHSLQEALNTKCTDTVSSYYKVNRITMHSQSLAFLSPYVTWL